MYDVGETVENVTWARRSTARGRVHGWKCRPTGWQHVQFRESQSQTQWFKIECTNLQCKLIHFPFSYIKHPESMLIRKFLSIFVRINQYGKAVLASTVRYTRVLHQQPLHVSIRWPWIDYYEHTFKANILFLNGNRITTAKINFIIALRLMQSPVRR